MRNISYVLLTLVLGCGKGTEQGTKASGDQPAAGSPIDNAACKDYKTAVEKAMACEKMSKASRDAMKKEYDDHMAEWSHGPADPKGIVANACKHAVRDIRDSADPACGL